jgi:prepilin-type N-terminal cleavage/methylation domain-containing protein
MPGTIADAKRVAGHKGLTLVEVLVVLVILSIALAIVAPSTSRSYENWILRTAGLRSVALFRLASDVARRDGTDLAVYYSNHRLIVLRRGSIFRELEVPSSIVVRPEKPRGAVFLPTGQIIASEPFVFENGRGRRMTLELGPLPGQVHAKEEAP